MRMIKQLGFTFFMRHLKAPLVFYIKSFGEVGCGILWMLLRWPLGKVIVVQGKGCISGTSPLLFFFFFQRAKYILAATQLPVLLSETFPGKESVPRPFSHVERWLWEGRLSKGPQISAVMGGSLHGYKQIDLFIGIKFHLFRNPWCQI